MRVHTLILSHAGSGENDIIGNKMAGQKRHTRDWEEAGRTQIFAGKRPMMSDVQ